MNRIEHPTGNGDLKSLRHFYDHDLVLNPAKGPDHFDFGLIKWMMPVVDLLRGELMSSVGRRCATRTQLIFWSREKTFAKSKSIWVIPARTSRSSTPT